MAQVVIANRLRDGVVVFLGVDGGWIESVSGFVGMNYTNGFEWGDGDLCVDADGSIYTISEDDWSLYVYLADVGRKMRIGSSYLNHPSGLAIARSTPGFSSTGSAAPPLPRWRNVVERS